MTLGSEYQIREVDYLDKARPELGEPTLGVIVEDLLFYVANSPWGAYKQGELMTEILKKTSF